MLLDQELCLRPVRISDSDILYQAINDPTLVRFNSPYTPIDEINHQEWLHTIVKDDKKRIFMIEKENKILGSVKLFDIDLLHRNAEISIRLFNLEDCSQGIGSRALHLLCDHAYRDLGLVRVWLRVFNNNERAIKAYEKAGFLKEGTMRKAVFIDGKFQDVIIMAKVNDELS